MHGVAGLDEKRCLSLIDILVLIEFNPSTYCTQYQLNLTDVWPGVWISNIFVWRGLNATLKVAHLDLDDN